MMALVLLAGAQGSRMSLPKKTGALCGALAILLGSIGLLGWTVHSTVLIQVAPDLPPIEPVTAVCLVLTGLALLGIVSDRPRVTFVGSAVAATLAAASLLEGLFHSIFGLDEIVARTSPASAFCFIVLAASLILTQISPLPKKSPVLGVSGFLVASVAAACGIGVVWGSGGAFGLGDWTSMALSTAGGFLLLGMGAMAVALDISQVGLRQPWWAPIGAFVFMATVRLGLLQTFFPEHRTGVSSTLTLLGAISVPVIAGLFVHFALKAHLQRELLRSGNRRLEDEVLQRTLAETAVQSANEQLEQRVEERTRALEAANENLRKVIAQSELVEEDLRRQKELLQTMFDHVPLILKLTDRDGRIQMLNREWERVLGRTLDEIENQGVDLLEEGYPDPVDRQRILDFVANSNGEWADFKTTLRDGRVIDTTWAVVRLSDGAIICIGQDISQRKQAEQELRQQKEILETIFDHIPVMVSFVDQNGRAKLVNREWERILGWSFDEIKDRDMDIIVQEHYPDPTEREQAREFNRNSDAEWADFKIKVRDGRVIDASWAIVRLSDGTAVCFGQDISERKQAELDLRKQKEILQKIFDHIPLMVGFVDQSGVPQVVNRAWERTLGWTLDEIRTQNIDVIKENYPDPQYRENVRDFLASSASEWVDFKTRVRDGRVIDTSWTMLRLSDGTGIGIGQDITKRKRVEEALKESEERFRQLAENIRDLFWIKTPDLNRVIYFSPSYNSISGRTREDAYRDPNYQDFLRRVVSEDRERMTEFMERPVEKEYEIDYRITHPDGSIHWVSDRGFPVRDQSGQIYRVAGITHDITEQKLAEKALRESEERFRQLTENINEVFWLRSPDLKELIYVSPMYEKVCGRTRESLYAAGPEAVVHPEDRSRVIETLENLAGREFDIEYRIVTMDGEVRWIRDRGFPIRNQADEIYRVGGVAEDITARKEAEDRLKGSSEQLRALSASLQSAREMEATRIARQIHDELGGVLTGLRWELEALQKMIDRPLDGCHLKAMQDKLTAMVGLTDTTINVVRRIASELRPSILDDLGLMEAIEWQTQQFQARTGIECRCKCSLQSIALSDQQSTALFRIVQEALTNILRHAQATRVAVAMSEEDGVIVLTVTDNGRGITEAEKLGRDSLGLLGMQERAHLIGGSVDIAGLPGIGTTLQVRVPVAKAGAAATV